MIAMVREDEAFPPVQPCAHCDRMVRWTRTAASGTPYPLDADPHPDGNQVWLPRERVVQQLGPKAAKRHRASGLPLFRWHGVDCAGTRAMTGTGQTTRVQRRDPPAREHTRTAALDAVRRAIRGHRRRR